MTEPTLSIVRNLENLVPVLAVTQATDDMYEQIKAYKKLKDKIDRETKVLKVQREKLEAIIAPYSEIVDSDGVTMLTFNMSVPTRFDQKAFKERMPEIYNQFLIKGEPVRTLLLKNIK